MATINLVGAGLSRVSVGGAVKRTTTIGGLAMTPPPSITPATISASVAATLAPSFSDLQALINAVPANVWAAAIRTLTSAAPPTADQVAEATRTELAPELAKLDGLTLSGSGVLADVRAVVGVGLAGTGVPPTFNDDGAMTSPGDPWRAA